MIKRVESILKGLPAIQDQHIDKLKRLEQEKMQLRVEADSQASKYGLLKEEFDIFRREAAKQQAELVLKGDQVEKVMRERDLLAKSHEQCKRTLQDREQQILDLTKMSEMKDKAFLKKMKEAREEVGLQLVAVY